MNPGPSRAPIESVEDAKTQGNGNQGGGNQGNGNQGNGDDDFSRFGLMESFVKQWTKRLPAALALGAGEHIKLPPGNMELIHMLEPFENK